MTPAHPIRKMELKDIPQVVAVHLESFQGFFLSFLGPAFLKQLYTSILGDPSGMAFVFVGDCQVMGFVAGTIQPAGFYRRLIQKHWWRFALASLSPMIRRPSIFPRLLRALKLPGQDLAGDRCGTLLSLAVLPGFQGRGIGSALVREFLSEAADKQLGQVILTTDRNQNDDVNRFYQGLGFLLNREFITPEGREMNEYKFHLQ